MDTGRLGGSCNNPGETVVGQRGGRSGSVYLPVPRARLSSAIRTRARQTRRRADCCFLSAALAAGRAGNPVR